MAGLFGLFRKKNVDAEPAPPRSTEAYYLNADDAKTFGNIDYMRKSRPIKHKFPKTAGNGGEFELETEISSLEMRRREQLGLEPLPVQPMAPAPTGAAAQPTPPNPQANERRRADSSMDAFRKMAKEIKR